jgi:voltage-gated potassium channel
MEYFSFRRFAYATSAFVLALVAGTIGFTRTLDESWVDAFYRSVVTVTLTGIDTKPTTTSAKFLTIVLLVVGVAIFAYIATTLVELIARGVVTDAWGERRRRRAIDRLEDHYIICGFGRVGRRVAEEFTRAGASFVVLDFSEEALATAREENVLFIEGNGTEDEDLARAGLARARGLVAASDDDSDNLYITLSAKAQRPDLVVVARASDEEAEKKLRLAGADRVVLPYATAGRVMASLLVKPQVAAFLNVVSDSGGPDLSFEEIEIPATWAAAGRSIRDLRVREQTGASIIAVRRDDGTFDTSPMPDTPLKEGDVLVGVGTADEIRALEDLFAPPRDVDR